MCDLIIGIGNALRRDDGVGIVAARLLRDEPGVTARIVEHSGEGVGLIDLWRGQGRVIVIDAAEGPPPGAIVQLAAHVEPPAPGLFHYSSHAFGLAEAVALSHALGDLPAELWLIGVAGVDWGFGPGLSPAVEAALPTVLAAVSALRKRES
jgi:hydrogenase maturation protease